MLCLLSQISGRVESAGCCGPQCRMLRISPAEAVLQTVYHPRPAEHLFAMDLISFSQWIRMN